MQGSLPNGGQRGLLEFGDAGMRSFLQFGSGDFICERGAQPANDELAITRWRGDDIRLTAPSGPTRRGRGPGSAGSLRRSTCAR
jgi:hypothetical protein